jgi:hypothetical protein
MIGAGALGKPVAAARHGETRLPGLEISGQD